MMDRVILIALAVLWFGGCTTVRPAAPPPSPIAAEYREAQAEIHQQQAELAITGAKIEAESRGITGDIARLEESIAAAPPDFGETDRLAWLSQAQALRERAEGHQAETEKLNRQLADEREMTRHQGELFDKQEEAWQRALSEREAENTALRVENKAVKGQRNTFLAVLITAGGIAALFIVITVLRKVNIIPV
jgi:chromosome segregation ATPase